MFESLFGLGALSNAAFSSGPFQFIVPRDLGVVSALELDGATISLLTGTKMEIEVNEYFRAGNMSYEPVPVSSAEEAELQFLRGASDVLVVPASALDGLSLPTGFVALPEFIGGTAPNPDDGETDPKPGDEMPDPDGDDPNDKPVPTAGDDSLVGTNGRDVVRLLAGDDAYSGRGGADKILGNAGNDNLSGNSGQDRLVGGGGRDTLNGGKGNDILIGGKGADIFEFEKLGSKNKDTILDFKKGVDILRLDGSDYSIGTADGNVVLRFGGGETLTLDGVKRKKGVAASIEQDNETPPEQGDSNPAIVLGLGGKFDQALNEISYKGALNWAKTSGQTFAEFEILSEAQMGPSLARFAEQEFDPVVATGFAFVNTLDKVATDYPDTSFAIIDAIVDQPNVTSYTFAEHEGAYVMGVIAAMASESETVGFIGGMDVPLVRRYSTAFEQGVMETNPDAKVIVNMTGTTPAAWNDPVKGGELADAQIAKGADVIFTAAGSTSLGVLQAVADADIYGIGADFNLNSLHPGNILTSMVKRADLAVEDVFTRGDAVPGGVRELGIADGGLDYAFDEFNKDILTRDIRKAADKAMDDIASGAIVVQDFLDIA